MDTETKAPGVKLDWARLLGFDQATQTADKEAARRLNDPRLIKMGAKFGCKRGMLAPRAV